MLTCEELVDIFDNDELNIRGEEHAFEAIVKWIGKDPDNRKTSMSKYSEIYCSDSSVKNV